MVVKSPSNILWQIDLKSAEVKEYEEKESFTFTIKKLMQLIEEEKGSFQEGGFFIPMQYFWEGASESLKNYKIPVTGWAAEAAGFQEFYDFICDDPKFTNYFRIAEEPQNTFPPSCFFIIQEDENMGIVLTDEDCEPITEENINNYKNLAFTLSMPK